MGWRRGHVQKTALLQCGFGHTRIVWILQIMITCYFQTKKNTLFGYAFFLNIWYHICGKCSYMKNPIPILNFTKGSKLFKFNGKVTDT